MKARPILLSGAMVRATLVGRKTHTRRIIKPQPYNTPEGFFRWDTGRKSGLISSMSTMTDDASGIASHCPYGRTGDLLWVREAFKKLASGKIKNGYGEARYGYGYQADNATIWKNRITKIWDLTGQPDRGPMQFREQPWKPSIHMPRAASRITLELTGVRVERLQDIGVEDAIAEGFARITKDGEIYKYGIPDRDGYPGTDDNGWPWELWRADPRLAYRTLWEAIHGPGSWADNPWVWVLEFKPHQCNVDDYLRGAV